jgi:putative NIF3 family GTP cyclohydrolase 1 type 2
MPGHGAEPYTGEVGHLESVTEIRLEVVVPKSALPAALAAMREAHPYEEVAFDIYPLLNKGTQWGLGRVGSLRTPMSFEGFCEMVRDVLEVEEIRPSGDPEAMIQKVAVLGGSGGDKIALARALGADVFVTGEVKHSQLLHAQAIGLNVIDATHFYTERPGMISLAPKLNDLLSSEGITVEYYDDPILCSR